MAVVREFKVKARVSYILVEVTERGSSKAGRESGRQL